MQSEKAKILVVDDETSIRNIVARQLESEGYNCVTASDGREAIETASVQHFDLVLTDVKMPHMSGIEVLTQIIANHPDTCVMMMTAVTDSHTAVEAMRLGACDYVTKPFDLEALSTRIRRAFETRQLQKENKDFKLRLAEKALKQSKENYSALVENLSDAVFKIKDGAIAWCNEKVEEIYGLTREEVIGKDSGLLLTGGVNSSEYMKTVNAMIEEKGHFQGTTIIKKKDGDIIDIEYSISRIPHIHPVELVVVARDITERKRAHEQLRLAEEKYRAIFENSAVAITVTDEKQNIVFWNEFAEALLKMGEDELYMKSVRSLYPEAEWKKIKSQNIRRRGIQHQVETRIIRGDGEIIDVDLSLSVIRGTDEKITGSIGIIADITERKKAEEAMRELDRLKSEFIANTSHELRTPLQGIIGSTKLMLAGKVTDPETQREFLTIIDKQSRRLTELINDLLDISRLESGRFNIEKHPVSITDVVRDSIQELNALASEKAIEIVEEIPATLPEVLADEKRLKQVIINILGNAIKFSSEGNEITVKTEGKPT